MIFPFRKRFLLRKIIEIYAVWLLRFKAIKNIKETWSGITLRVETHKDKGIYRVHVNDDIFQSLEDHLMRLSAIKTSK